MNNLLNFIWPFLNSSFFIAIVTALAGLAAFKIYKNNKKDAKIDAANIILLEIQSAERNLNQAQENMKKGILEENFYIMQNESWNKYKYLFVRDFDRDEWDAITNFYHKCQLFDSSVSHQSSFFQKNEEQIRINMQRITADYFKEIIEDESKRGINTKRASEFQKEYLATDLSFYSPVKPVNDAKKILENWNIIIYHSSIGTKLKHMAGFKK